MSKPSIIRQIVDLQAQAERLIQSGGNMPEIETFAEYNEEVKAYLLSNIDDEFILNYVRQIPSLNLDQIEGKAGLLTVFLSVFSGTLSTHGRERDKIERALKEIKYISDKYASYEMMIRNHFDD